MSSKPVNRQTYPAIRGTQILATDSVQQYSQKLARIALDEMYQFVALLDARGTLLEVNRAALEGAGLTLEDVEGSPFWLCFWWAVSPEIQQTLKSAIARSAQGEFNRYDVEIYGRAGGKETIIIDFSLIPVKDETGQVVFMVAEGRDISEKKVYEREVARQNADLQSLLKRISELDDIKTQFFANVSHELRTPLALIIGPAERLLKSDPPLDPDLQRESAQVIVRNARMLLKHVNDLLDVSKLDAGKLKIELVETDVAGLVRFVASHFDMLASEKKILLQIDTAGVLAAAVDPEKLQRVLMNLLSNAFKFVPGGGTVRCKLETENSHLRLSVEDSGPGVRAELREAIFERFRQGDGGENRQFGGTGLGLAIASEFVKMHQGRIAVRDSSLGGALFEVTIPLLHLASGPAGQGSGLEPAPPALLDRSSLDGLMEGLLQPAQPLVPSIDAAMTGAAGRPLVLVVEDNPDMNRFVAQCLSQHYRVARAFDGREGVEQAMALLPDLIVSDIMMPVFSGAQMVAELRTHSALDETPIVLLSAKADEELKTRLLENGAQDFVSKPFNERDLLVRVRNLMTVRQSQQALRAADRRKDEFLATLAHELRNPLAPIRHAAKIRNKPGASEEQVQWSHGVIDRQVEHMARLLDDLLEVSRITRGKLEIRKVRLQLKDSLAAVVETVRPLIEARGQRLVMDFPPLPVAVDADPVRFAQIFSNLLANAAKYTGPGGLITIRARCVENRVAITVADTGIGIEAHALPAVFEMFSQVTSALDRSEGGLGIGLSLTRGLVSLHGGSIEAHSGGLGLGSQFTVTLPFAPAMLPDSLALTQAAPASGVGPDCLRVLVVDDNRDSADSCAILLELDNHQARVAYSGAEALELAAGFEPQCVLLDIGMPGMNGYEVARNIRRSAWGKTAMLVAITGWGQLEDKQLAERAGFDHHFTKPIDFELIRQLLMEHCNA